MRRFVVGISRSYRARSWFCLRMCDLIGTQIVQIGLFQIRWLRPRERTVNQVRPDLRMPKDLSFEGAGVLNGIDKLRPYRWVA